jgi:hypothetical protein
MNGHFGKDPGDKYDKLKWDFDEEEGYDIIEIDDYPYRVLSKNSDRIKNRVANKLHRLRRLNNRIADKIDNYAKGPGVEIYKYIHKDNDGTTNYLLSEMKENTGFQGLNKPKGRIRSGQEFVGADEDIRATYRHIFLDLDISTDRITDEDLELYVHELAHTGANHVRWRPDDHKADFKSFEKLLWHVIKNEF